MSNLVTVPKNGTLANTNSKTSATSRTPNLATWLDDFFDRDLSSVFTSNFNTGITLPKVNIKETADDYIVEMAVPGLKKSDIKIDVDNQLLAISSEAKEEKKTTQDSYTRREFGYSSFKRTFTLPETVDDDKINAKYVDGILNIVLPKKEEAKQRPSRSISIS